jgi:hypothetical protein
VYQQFGGFGKRVPRAASATFVGANRLALGFANR